jgi:hypothetical protein
MKAVADSPYRAPLSAANSASVVNLRCSTKIELTDMNTKIADKLNIASPIPSGAMEPASRIS